MCKCRISSRRSEIQWDCSDACVMLRQYTHTPYTRAHIWVQLPVTASLKLLETNTTAKVTSTKWNWHLLHWSIYCTNCAFFFRTRNIQVRQKQTTANVTLHQQKINIHYIIWWRTKLLTTTRNGHGQSVWSPIHCEGLYFHIFHAMSKK